MTNHRWFFFVVLLCTTFIYADSHHELLKKADQLYADGKYQDALAAYQNIPGINNKSKSLDKRICDCYYQLGNKAYKEDLPDEALNFYKKIIELGFENGPVYYNLGNCYFRMNDTGRAILNYERARKHMPNDEDLKENLSIARSQLSEDKITQNATDFFILRAVLYFYLLPGSMQRTFIMIGYGLFVFILILYILFSSPRLKRIIKSLLWISGVSLAIVTVSSIGRMINDHFNVEAVILQDNVNAMGEPRDDSGVVISKLYAGKKVRLGRESGEWITIILPENEGWVKSSVLERI